MPWHYSSGDRNGIRHEKNLCCLSHKGSVLEPVKEECVWGPADAGSPRNWSIKQRMRRNGELRACKCYIICWNTSYYGALSQEVSICIDLSLFISLPPTQVCNSRKEYLCLMKWHCKLRSGSYIMSDCVILKQPEWPSDPHFLIKHYTTIGPNNIHFKSEQKAVAIPTTAILTIIILTIDRPSR